MSKQRSDIEEACEVNGSRGTADTFVEDQQDCENQQDCDIAILQRALENPNERKSQLCCLFCCDLVRASVIMNFIWILLVIIYVVWSMVSPAELAYLGMNPLFEDDVIDAWVIIGIVKFSVSVLCCCLGILGAVLFRKYLVLVGSIWYIVYAIVTLLQENRESGRWIGAFLAVIFSYPSIHLFVSMLNGSITRETYPREAHCCCGRCTGTDRFC
jgi:hypothetical protein